jgi:4'-phosphopantetheinyl transferase
VRPLGPNAVDLWVARPNAAQGADLLARFRSWLAPEEEKRFTSFCFDKHRHEYLVTRDLVRTALSTYRAVEPAAWTFIANAYGRPAITPPCGLTFNLSNTQTLVVCAVAEELEIGVDVEPIERAPTILGIADTVFSPAELAELSALAPAAARERAVSLWTIKEAYIKARGMGMSLPVREITVRFAETIVLAAAPSDEHPDGWALQTLDFEGHRIAVASPSPAPRIEVVVPPWS